MSSPTAIAGSASGALDEVELFPASESDIFQLTEIHVAAFADDNAVRLVYNRDEQENAVINMINSQFRSPKFPIAMAVNPPSGHGLGWIGYRLFEDNELKKNEAMPSAEAKNIGTEGEQREETGGKEVVREHNITNTPSALAALISNTGKRMQYKRMSGQKHILLNTLVTSPRHRGKGVGTAMVRWIVAKADAERLSCWVQSSPAAYGLYLKAGFEVTDSLEVDLRTFAPGGKGGQEGYGMYTFRYMIRHPVNSSC